MTRDEVRELIANAAYEFGDWQEANLIADKVLAAFAARGLIIGEQFDPFSVSDNGGNVFHDIRDMPDGIALVRVVQ